MNNSEIYKRLYKDYSKKYINKILISVLFGVLVAVSTSAIAWLLDPAIKKIFVEKDQSLIFIIPLLIIVAFTVKGFALYFAKAIMIRVAEEIKKTLQSQMAKSLINADTQIIDQKHSGKFISNLTYDVNQITNMLSTAILNLFKDSLTLFGLLFVMFYQNWKLSLIAIIMIPIAGMASKTLGKRVGKVVTEAQEKSGFLNTHLIELFKNHKLIKIFQREDYESKRTDGHLDQLKEKNIKINTVFVRLSPIMETLTGIMIAILIFYSGKLALNNEIEIGNFFSFLAAMMLAYQPVRALSNLNMILKQGLSAANRILPIIDNQNNIIDQEGSQDINITNSEIKFNNINFKYNADEKNILTNVNLNITGGKMTSLVGHSGAGKSTILNLIPRFYDVQSGDIMIDDQSIYKVKIKSLRDQISLVSQDTTLFDDTIKNNIRYAKDNVSDEEIVTAAKFSYAHEFIDKLPNKYETMIGENGIRLSGGEKQRLSIARAMIKKSPIILLDEATSSLDAETESKIQDALKILTKDRTTIVIAHRLSTILNLIPRFYDVQSGDILIDNQSIYKVKIKSLRDKISLVSQDTTLFDDTIKNNIKYAKNDVTDEEVISAAKFSYAHEFIEKLPKKYETIIGENGIRLSGGEKQRLSIARAMIKKSPIILLDEATSSLDAETESKIQGALKILTKDRTTIVIAHRLSTILNSDQIYIIDAGNVVAKGKHDELLDNSELYKNFYEKQIRKG